MCICMICYSVSSFSILFIKWVTVLTFSIKAIFSIYICYFNQFPMDYVNGELLVNPDRAVRSTIICYAYSLGIINGSYLCRRFFPFNAKAGDIKTRIIRCLVGTILLMFLLICPLEICFRGNLNYKLIFIFPLLMGLCITAGYPLVFSKIKFLYYNDSHGNN